MWDKEKSEGMEGGDQEAGDEVAGECEGETADAGETGWSGASGV